MLHSDIKADASLFSFRIKYLIFVQPALLKFCNDLLGKRFLKKVMR